MCDVCEADRVLGEGREGYRYTRKGIKGAVIVRATGEAEGPARYQVRREGDPWPTSWRRADKFANVMANFGFDVHWYAVHPTMKAWVTRKRDALPTARDLRWTEDAKAERQRARFAAGAGNRRVAAAD